MENQVDSTASNGVVARQANAAKGRAVMKARREAAK